MAVQAMYLIVLVGRIYDVAVLVNCPDNALFASALASHAELCAIIVAPLDKNCVNAVNKN